MELYQNLAAKPLGQSGSADESSTAKAADDASLIAAGRRLPKPRKVQGGRIVHYATGAALGAFYCVAADRWAATTSGFGSAFGSATMLALDDVGVPAFGWGAPPWDSPANTHLYSLSSHLVFGVALEGARRLGTAALV